MSDTPRTDEEARAKDGTLGEYAHVPTEFARRLERHYERCLATLPRVHASPPSGLVLTLPDGSSAVFRASCDIAEKVLDRLSATPFQVNPQPHQTDTPDPTRTQCKDCGWAPTDGHHHACLWAR